MLTLPNAIVSVLIPFATLFSTPAWRKAQVLLAGAILTPGQRTVAAALRVMGRSAQRDYARYHEVLNRGGAQPGGAQGAQPGRVNRGGAQPGRCSTGEVLNRGGAQPGRCSTGEVLNRGGAQPGRCSTGEGSTGEVLNRGGAQPGRCSTGEVLNLNRGGAQPGRAGSTGEVRGGAQPGRCSTGEVLNRCSTGEVWSPRLAARILLALLLQHLDGGGGPLIFGIGDTLERRRGPRIKPRGIYRDAVRSSRHQLVKASGLR